jgi:hypothetical protein
MLLQFVDGGTAGCPAMRRWWQVISCETTFR